MSATAVTLIIAIACLALAGAFAYLSWAMTRKDGRDNGAR